MSATDAAANPWMGPLNTGPTATARGLGRATWWLWLVTAVGMSVSIAVTHLSFFIGLALFVGWASLSGSWRRVWAAQPRPLLAAYGAYLLVVFVSGLASDVPGEVMHVLFQKRLPITFVLIAFAALRPNRRQLALWLGTWLGALTATALVALVRHGFYLSQLLTNDANLGEKVRLSIISTALTGAEVLAFGAVVIVARLAGPMRDRIGRWERPVLSFALAVLLGALSLSFTRSAWIAITVAIAGILLLNRRWWTLIGLPAYWLALVYLLAPLRFPTGNAAATTESSTNWRLEMWQVAAQVYRDHPILGVGDRDMHPVFHHYRPASGWYEAYGLAGHFHSTWFHTAASLGTVGLIAILALFAVWLVALWRSWRTAPPGIEADLALGALAAFVALQIFGLWEANFGDMEVIIVVLALSGLALGRPTSERADP